MHAIKPNHVFPGMKVWARSGFPGRCRMIQLKGPEKWLTPVRFQSTSATLAMEERDELLELLIVWSHPPYAIADHADDGLVCTSRVWFDTREIELFVGE